MQSLLIMSIDELAEEGQKVPDIIALEEDQKLILKVKTLNFTATMCVELP